MEFKDRLRYERNNRDVTQTEFGKLFNLSKQAISSYENGVSYPNPEVLIKFADYFDVSVDYLLGRINVRGPYKELKNTLHRCQVLYKPYREAFQDVRNRLIRRHIIPHDKPISKDIIEMLIKYGEEATFEILRYKKK